MSKFINIGNTALKDYDGEIILVGINYDKRTKQHSCVIERISDNCGDKCGDKLSSSSNTHKQRILDYLSNHSEAKSQEIAAKLKLGISRTKVYLADLANADLIIRLGSNKDRTYILNRTYKLNS